MKLKIFKQRESGAMPKKTNEYWFIGEAFQVQRSGRAQLPIKFAGTWG